MDMSGTHQKKHDFFKTAVQAGSIAALALHIAVDPAMPCATKPFYKLAGLSARSVVQMFAGFDVK